MEEKFERGYNNIVSTARPGPAHSVINKIEVEIISKTREIRGCACTGKSTAMGLAAARYEVTCTAARFYL